MLRMKKVNLILKQQNIISDKKKVLSFGVEYLPN